MIYDKKQARKFYLAGLSCAEGGKPGAGFR